MTSQLSPARLRTARAISWLAAAFFLMDGGMKLSPPQFVVEATVQLGYPASVIPGLGILLISCTLLYLLPRTAVLGAILLTGYLGGAVATHVRISGPVFNIVFPVVFGSLVWTGLWLRNTTLRLLLPLSTDAGR